LLVKNFYFPIFLYLKKQNHFQQENLGIDYLNQDYI